MAEVTYYYNVVSSPRYWTDSDNMADGNLETFGSTSASGATDPFIETTCDGTDLGTITKVEIRVYGYGDGNDQINLYFDIEYLYENIMPTSPDWATWHDVTNDLAKIPWTWNKIANLVLPYLHVRYEKTAKANMMYCAKVEIRVTYTEAGEPPYPNQYNKIFYTEEPPTPNAWNQVKQEAGAGYKKLLYV